MKFTRRGKILGVAFAAIAVFIGTSAESCGSTAHQASQDITNKVGDASSKSVAYPFDEMVAGKWLERQMLREHLLRQNNKAASRWIIVLNQQGQPITQFAIQGMAFSPDSQMTTSQLINGDYTNDPVTDAPGDNGTYGPEPGNVAFYTTSGVEIQLSKMVPWIETDAPIDLPTKPLLTMDANAKPSVGSQKVGQ
jgi:hypothetical protein